MTHEEREPAAAEDEDWVAIDTEEMTGKLKHPVQLDPLTFHPLSNVDEPTERVYEIRDELCRGMDQQRPHSSGWTLPAFTLTASHLGVPDGLLRELGRFVPATYTDPDWIQCYESSEHFDAPYYTTSHGLFLQAVTDAFVTDYWDEVRVGHALPDEWTDASFENLHTESRVFSSVAERVSSRRRTQ